MADEDTGGSVPGRGRRTTPDPLPSDSIPSIPRQNSNADPPATWGGLWRAMGLDPSRDYAAEQVEAVERQRQGWQSSEKPIVPEDSAVAHKPQAVSERSFNVALAAYGAMFGTGLLQLAAHDWYFGPIFTLGGGLGLMSIHPLIRPKFQMMRSNRSLWAMVAMTWLFLAANIGFSIYGHFWSRPFTIGVSPIAGPAVGAAPPEPNVPRVYTKKTVLTLADLCANRTALQCDEFMADEKGRWISIGGKVQSIFAKGEDTGVVFTSDPAHLISCDFSRNWRDRLNTLRPFEPIQVTGKIGPTQTGNPLLLQECELSP